MFERLKNRLDAMRGRKEPVEDGRSGRVVAVIHCILNQNVRDRGAAALADANWAVLDLCRAHRVSVLQLPCPEEACLGVARERPEGVGLRTMMETEGCRRVCRDLAARVTDQALGHVAQGHRLLAVLGGNRESPGCAVHRGRDGRLAPESGVFMRALQEALLSEHLDVPFRPIRDAEPECMAEDLAWVDRVFHAARASAPTSGDAEA